MEDVLIIVKDGMPDQRLYGPRAMEVFKSEWEPYGWEILNVEDEMPFSVHPSNEEF